MCPEGFEYFDGNCYFFSMDKAPTRGEAAFLCQQFNEKYSKIVSIDNGYDDEYVRGTIPNVNALAVFDWSYILCAPQFHDFFSLNIQLTLEKETVLLGYFVHQCLR